MATRKRAFRQKQQPPVFQCNNQSPAFPLAGSERARGRARDSEGKREGEEGRERERYRKRDSEITRERETQRKNERQRLCERKRENRPPVFQPPATHAFIQPRAHSPRAHVIFVHAPADQNHPTKTIAPIQLVLHTNRGQPCVHAPTRTTL